MVKIFEFREAFSFFKKTLLTTCTQDRPFLLSCLFSTTTPKVWFCQGKIPTTQTQANSPPSTLYSESEILAVSSYLSRVGVKAAPRTEEGWFHFPERIAALQARICSNANTGQDRGTGKQEDSFSNIWAVGNRWTLRDPRRQFPFAFLTSHWRMLKLPSLNFSYL